MNIQRRARAIGVAFICGVIFALGLTLSGMTNPAKVLGFLDFFGAWDPSLLAVMVGAIGVNAPLTRWLLRLQAPLLQPHFSTPVQTLPWRAQLDRPLLVGAALFGVGWGLSGYCPGPALVSLGSSFVGPRANAVTFSVAMVAGMLIFSLFERYRAQRRSPRTSACCPPGDHRGMVTVTNDAPSR